MNRTTYQGVINIIRFNPGIFITAGIFILIGIAGVTWTSGRLQIVILAMLLLAFGSLALSLLASHWIYDRSDIYTLPSLRDMASNRKSDQENWLSINAGFDEISSTIKARFPGIHLRVLDFYDSSKHTEVSIARARKVYPPGPETETITSDVLPAKRNSIQKIIAFFSLHEIRNHEERVHFFNELNRSLSDRGELHLTEHMRDLPNLLVYHIGALHFHTRKTWQKTFDQSNFTIKSEIKTTPFITSIILIKK